MKSLLLIAMAFIWTACTAPTDPEPDNTLSEDTTILTIQALPAAIPADGVSKATVFVEFRINGEPVADSTRIIVLNSVGTLANGTVYATGGVAIDTLTSDTVAGLGWLIAYSDGVRDSIEIMFTEPTP